MKQDIIHAMDILLEIAEKYYPKYHSCDNIAWVNDLYKKIEGDES